MRNDKKNIVVEYSLEFALQIISFSEKLEGLRKCDLANNFLNQELR
jgi:hypothetical protein